LGAKVTRRLFAACSAALVFGFVVAASSFAITYGQPDGYGHPEVGAMVVDLGSGPRAICSGTLIEPDVFLTAAHCVAALEVRGIPLDDVFVTFDPVFQAGTSELVPGVAVRDPAYGQGGGGADSHDIAVILLERSVTSWDGRAVTPAELPEAGLLDGLDLTGQRFTAVGYGVQERSTGGGPPTFGPSGTRMFSVSTFRALNETWLRLSQNPATGDAGTCFGDSGGPNFLGAGANETNIIAAITITGDAVCRATNTTYRLDTPSARSFLSQFVTLP
jgi:secreted trypsin-like serine protease